MINKNKHLTNETSKSCNNVSFHAFMTDIQTARYFYQISIKNREYKSFIKWLNKDFTLALQTTAVNLNHMTCKLANSF